MQGWAKYEYVLGSIWYLKVLESTVRTDTLLKYFAGTWQNTSKYLSGTGDNTGT